MNMTTTRRLDDRFNAVLVVLAIVGAVAMNVDTLRGHAFGRDGLVATAPAAPAAHAVVLASR